MTRGYIKTRWYQQYSQGVNPSISEKKILPKTAINVMPHINNMIFSLTFSIMNPPSHGWSVGPMTYYAYHSIIFIPYKFMDSYTNLFVLYISHCKKTKTSSIDPCT